MDAQLSAVPRRAFAQLKLVGQLHSFFQISDLATVTHTLVASHLDYCNARYIEVLLKTVQKLQLVQNAAFRLLTKANYRQHAMLLLQPLNWLLVYFQAQFKVLVITYLGPVLTITYLKDPISQYKPSQAVRSSEEALLSVPLPLQACLLVT